MSAVNHKPQADPFPSIEKGDAIATLQPQVPLNDGRQQRTAAPGAIDAGLPALTENGQSSASTLAFSIVIYIAVGVALFYKYGSKLPFWAMATYAFFGLGFAAAAVPRVRKWMLNAVNRTALLIFAVTPAIIACVVVSPPNVMMRLVRILFTVLVILLPGMLYYMFVAERKVSSLNEFINNLDRLGLLIDSISQESMRRRFASYLKKFEALYGQVSKKTVNEALEAIGTADTQLVGTTEATKDIVFTSETSIPVVTASILIALGWILILPPITGELDWKTVLTPEGVPEHFAFLGAYFFCLQMLFRRYMVRDLRPSAYVATSMRIILAVVGIWVITVIPMWNDGDPARPETKYKLLIVAFVVGVFPSVVWQFVQSVFKKITFARAVIPSMKTQLPISDLDGLTVWHEARLQEEDIENIPNMATADLVELMLHTRFSPDRIIDWVDQGILYTHLGPEKKKSSGESVRERLRRHGIRTATSLVETYRRSQALNDVGAFEAILMDGDGRSPLRGLADAVQTNPNFQKIWTWRQLPLDKMSGEVAALTCSTTKQKT
jgi:hypothetical protein